MLTSTFVVDRCFSLRTVQWLPYGERSLCVWKAIQWDKMPVQRSVFGTTFADKDHSTAKNEQFLKTVKAICSEFE